jgi:predicted acyltransferase
MSCELPASRGDRMPLRLPPDPRAPFTSSRCAQALSTEYKQCWNPTKDLYAKCGAWDRLARSMLDTIPTSVKVLHGQRAAPNFGAGAIEVIQIY